MQSNDLRVRCLRKRDYLSDEVLGGQLNWFGMLCTDDFDVPAFQQWHHERHAAAAAAEEQRQQQAAQEGQQAGFGMQQGSGDEDYWALQQQYYTQPGGAGEQPQVPPEVAVQAGHAASQAAGEL